LPIGGLSVAFFGATRVYRPEYRGGIVYNYGMPRDLVVKITRRPIYVQKVYRVNNWKGGRFDNNGPNRGIGIYAPRFSKDNRPNRGPKKFADNPNDFRPKAKLKDTFKGDVPKGWGPSAKGVKSIAKEDPDAFKRKHDFDGRDFGDRGKDKDRDRDKDKGQASKDFDRDGRQGHKGELGGPPPPSAPPPVVKGATGDATSGKTKDNKNNGLGNADIRTQTEAGTLRKNDNNDNAKDKDKNKNQNFGNQGGVNQFKQGSRDNFDQGGGGQGKQKNFGAPGGPGGSDQFKQGNRDNSDQGGGGQGKKKNFGEPGGPGPNQFKQGNRDQDDQGGGDQRKQKDFGGGGPGGPGGPPGGIKQFNQGGGQAQGDQGGGGGGGGGDKKCQKHPEKPECQGRN
jgi:hypothetical protein